jgi:hypothetical protein
MKWDSVHSKTHMASATCRAFLDRLAFIDFRITQIDDFRHKHMRDMTIEEYRAIQDEKNSLLDEQLAIWTDDAYHDSCGDVPFSNHLVAGRSRVIHL